MLVNYLKLAWRNIKRDSFFSILNIVGLGFGIAVSLLIIQYLRGEWNVDKHHADYQQVYQINTAFNLGEKEEIHAAGPSPLANKLVVDYPEVENAARIFSPPGIAKYLLKNGDLSFFEPKGVYTDSTFFDIFTYPFVEGSSEYALKRPNDIVISKTLANKLFKNESALNQSIEINSLWGDMTCQITGVIDTKTYRSHIDTELFINITTGGVGNRFANATEWAGNNMFNTYIKVIPNTDVAALERKFPALVESTAGDRLRQMGFSKAHSLIALEDIYLKSIAQGNEGPKGNITFFYIFAAIGAFILLIACINFMNLSTAKSSLRAKEVAVKKVLGAKRSTLALQFFTETLTYVFLSLLVAVIFIVFGQSYLQNEIGLQLISFSLNDWQLALWIGLVLSITSFLAGSYPALMLSSFNPLQIFSGKMGNNFSAVQVRKGLVITQFVISIILIQGILVIKEQMNYIQNEELGYSKTEKIVLPITSSVTSNNAQSLKQELKGLSAIKNVGITNTHPGLRNIEDALIFGELKTREEIVYARMNWADPDLIPTMGFELLAGRNFRIGDSSAAIITESALAGLGYNLDNALNKEIKWQWGDEPLQSREIIGILKDFHDSSLKETMHPKMFLLSSQNTQTFLIASLNTEDISKSISDVEDAWNNVNGAEPFEFYFMNDKVQSAYESEQKMSSLMMVFTVLAILISCLGLLGLSAFAADRRKKEIGIRKVLGASIASVVQLLSKEFVWLVLIALCIASPVAWYFSKEWLQTFKYSTEMPWRVYVMAGVLAIVICIVTVSFQSIKAALVNPVKNLKSE